jgi:hypothetical protein
VTFEEKLGGGGALSSLRGDFAGQGAYGEYSHEPWCHSEAALYTLYG